MNRRIYRGVPSDKKQSRKSVNTGLLDASRDSSMIPPKLTNLRISTREKSRRGFMLEPWNRPGDSSILETRGNEDSSIGIMQSYEIIDESGVRGQRPIGGYLELKDTL